MRNAGNQKPTAKNEESTLINFLKNGDINLLYAMAVLSELEKRRERSANVHSKIRPHRQAPNDTAFLQRYVDDFDALLEQSLKLAAIKNPTSEQVSEFNRLERQIKITLDVCAESRPMREALEVKLRTYTEKKGKPPTLDVAPQAKANPTMTVPAASEEQPSPAEQNTILKTAADAPPASGTLDEASPAKPSDSSTAVAATVSDDSAQKTNPAAQTQAQPLGDREEDININPKSCYVMVSRFFRPRDEEKVDSCEFESSSDDEWEEVGEPTTPKGPGH